MSAYTDEDLRRIVADNLRGPPPPRSSKVCWHLTTVVDIAVLMRKFEKAGSDNYKKSLRYAFDKNEAISALRKEASQQTLPMTAGRLLNLV